MTKTRQSQTPEFAMMQVLRVVPIVTLAESIGKSVSLVEKFSEPDDGRKIPAHYALLFDSMCHAVNGSTPFRDLFNANIDAAPSVTGSVKENVLEATAALGSLTATVLAALSVASDNGAALSAAERQEILLALAGLKKEVNDIERAVVAASVKAAGN